MSKDGDWIVPQDFTPTTFSNVPGPVDLEAALVNMRMYVQGLRGKTIPIEQLIDVAREPVPPWVYDMGVDEGWIDEAGNLTEKYWADFRDLNKLDRKP